ncbi:type II toxin-antitoxin system HigB family toxin [soil metagenome]
MQHIISKRKLREFWLKIPSAKEPLISWYNTVKKADWDNFSNVREDFRHADIYRDCVIFDIGGNKYRLITKIRYQKKRVYIRFVLMHPEYDKDLWKDDCEC